MALLLDGLGNRAVATSTGLHALAVDARGMRRREAALSGLLPAIVVYVFDVEGMQVAGKVSAIASVSTEALLLQACGEMRTRES